MTLDERIARYLERCPPAVAGSRGHDQTFAVACALVNGFALDEANALRHMVTYNATCSPTWKERDLRHKVQQAAKVAHSKPRGHLLGSREDRPEGEIRGAKVVPVSLTPKEPRSRTVGTLISEPYTHVGKKSNISTYIGGGDNTTSPASQNSNEIGIPVETVPLADAGLVSVPGCRVKRPEEIQMADADWQKLDTSGFAGEPMVQLAAWMFGPCTVLETREASSCES